MTKAGWILSLKTSNEQFQSELKRLWWNLQILAYHLLYRELLSLFQKLPNDINQPKGIIIQALDIANNRTLVQPNPQAMDKSNKIGHKEGVKEVKHIGGAIIQSHVSYMHFQHAWIWKEE